MTVRYDPVWHDDDDEPAIKMEECRHGDYVEYMDYAELEKERDELQKKLDDIEAIL